MQSNPTGPTGPVLGKDSLSLVALGASCVRAYIGHGTALRYDMLVIQAVYNPILSTALPRQRHLMLGFLSEGAKAGLSSCMASYQSHHGVLPVWQNIRGATGVRNIV